MRPAALPVRLVDHPGDGRMRGREPAEPSLHTEKPASLANLRRLFCFRHAV